MQFAIGFCLHNNARKLLQKNNITSEHMYGKSVIFRSLPLIRLCSVRYFKNGSSKKLLEFLADMPKANPGRIAEAQRQRFNIQKKSEKYGPSTVYLQVLGSGAPGVPNTLYLFTDQKRYLFNCGECTQRLAHEHKVKLSRLEHIFITSKSWRNIGGLPGLSLTLQDVGVPNITLHGPEGLEELYNATRRFVIMKDMNITKATCNSSADFKDNVMTVKYILLSPEEDFIIKDPAAKKPKLSSPPPDREFEQFMHDDTDYYRRDVRVAAPPSKPASPKHKESSSPPPPPPPGRTRVEKSEKVLQELRKLHNCTVAYVCTLNKRLGSLDLAKCVERGVKPGPLLGQLKSGRDVVLPDGTLVRSRDVKTPDDLGPVFIVLEVPELSYLNEAEFELHFADGNPPARVPTLVVHYTPPRVLNDPRYNLFMSRFGPSCQHLVLNSQNSCLGSEAVHRTQHKLHLLDPDIFPLLRDVSMPAVWNCSVSESRPGSPMLMKGLEELKKKIALAQFQNIVAMETPPPPRPALPAPSFASYDMPWADSLAGRTNTVFHLRPQLQLDRSAEPKLHVQDYIKETMDVDGFSDSLQRFRSAVDALRHAIRGTEAEYPKVVFLGTGSCIPSKTRNTSAIVLQIDEGRSMLLDCGEGTYGQLVRFYGPKRVGAFLRTLHAIYVSHLHADHHIGLIGVLQARAQALLEISSEPLPVYLLAPGQIMSWLSVYHQLFEPVLNMVALVPNQGLLHEAPTQPNALTPAILACLGLRDIQTCLVSHCPNAFGIALVIDDQHKLTYSGDTIPCEELLKIGQNSTLLIHEATMEDELAEEARVKMHSTTSQAIEQGELMHAKYTVLTHFSQRYARLPRLSQHILTNNSTVGIAFDNMQITFPDLAVLPLMYAPLQLMFAEHCVGMEAKAAARGRRRARSPEPTIPRNDAGKGSDDVKLTGPRNDGDGDGQLTGPRNDADSGQLTGPRNDDVKLTGPCNDADNGKLNSS